MCALYETVNGILTFASISVSQATSISLCLTCTACIKDNIIYVQNNMVNPYPAGTKSDKPLPPV